MDGITEYTRGVERRILGRVFSYGGRLHFVLEVDPRTGLARLSCRNGHRTQIVFMPVAEVMLRLEEECRRHDASADAGEGGGPALHRPRS